MKRLISSIIVATLVLAISLPSTARKKAFEEEHYYCFITDCGTQRLLVFERPLTDEECLDWFDFFCEFDCP